MNRHYIGALFIQYRLQGLFLLSGFLRVCASYYRKTGCKRSNPSVYQGDQGTFSPLLRGWGGSRLISFPKKEPIVTKKSFLI